MLSLTNSLAKRFHRSSAIVEGRNGLLSQKAHCSRGLLARDLKLCTIMSNYVSRRGDESTAAERLFGIQQRDLFELLLKDMPKLREGRHAA